MNRTKRMKRVADLVEAREAQARRELLMANHRLTEAEAALKDVYDQCRAVAENHDDLSLRFGRALIESGWIAATDRETRRDEAVLEANEARATWEDRRTRVDALARLVDRLRSLDDADAARAASRELEDLISGRHQSVKPERTPA